MSRGYSLYVRVVLALAVLGAVLLLVSLRNLQQSQRRQRETRLPDVRDARLDARVTDLRLDGATLFEALAALQEQTGANIVVRWDELHEEDHADARVRLMLRDVPLATALAEVLKQVPATSQLTWTVSDGIIYVTDDAYLRHRATTRFYGVRDLLRPGDAGALDRLATRITEHVAPDSWEDDPGGYGIIYPLNGVLVVHRSEAVHREIARFLQGLRRARAANLAGWQP